MITQDCGNLTGEDGFSLWKCAMMAQESTAVMRGDAFPRGSTQKRLPEFDLGKRTHSTTLQNTYSMRYENRINLRKQ